MGAADVFQRSLYLRAGPPQRRTRRRPAELVSAQLVSSSALACGEPILFDVEALIDSEDATRLAVGVTVRSLGNPVGASLDAVSLESAGPQL